MRLVLDASVAIAAARPHEPSHAAARARIERGWRGLDEWVVPSIFAVEVGGALTRRGESPAAVRAYLLRLTQKPHRIVTIGPRRADRACDAAIACKLRGADALYVWAASNERIPLCTLDAEMLTRGAALCQTMMP